MALKPVRILYSSRGFAQNLTDVKAQIYINQVAKATGANSLSLAEMDSANAPGIYFVTLSQAQLTAFGAGPGDTLEAVINSASRSAQAAFKEVITTVSREDLDNHLTAQDAAIAGVRTVVDSTSTDVGLIRSSVEDSGSGLSAIKAAIAALASQVGSLQNNTTFEAFLPESGLIKPASGNQVYRVPINVQNENGAIDDADDNTITVSVVNVSGVDRGSILQGYAAGTATAVRDAAGRYHIDLTLSAGATEEELIFTFDYSVDGQAFSKQRAVNVVNNVQANGFAQQVTLIDVQSTVTDTNTRVQAVQTGVTQANTKLDTAAALQATIAAQTAKLDDEGFGLEALQALLVSAEGAGFNSSLDSLRALGVYMRENVYSGGRAL